MVAFNRGDLDFILAQIQIAEAHSGLYGAPSIPLSQLIPNPLLPWGLRTVGGTFNNIIEGREDFGSADRPFPTLVDPNYIVGTGDGGFDTNGPTNPGTGQTVISGDYGDRTGNVVDSAPRTISNLLVDQTPNNPAAIYAALKYIGITGPEATTIVNDVAPLVDADKAAHHFEKAYLSGFNAANAGIGTAGASVGAIGTLANALQVDPDATVDPGIIELSGLALVAANRAVTSAQSAVTALQYDAGVNPADLAQAQAALVSAQAVAGLVSALNALLTDGSPIDPSDIADALAAAGAAGTFVGEITALRDALLAPKDVAVAAADASTLAVQDFLRVATDLQIEFNDNGTLSIPNVAPDEGISAPFNSWMTLFGQFFDHGLDLVAKTADEKVYIPLQPDDPLYVPGGRSNFMVITRTEADAKNITTPFVDQNQTYTSHASHQVFLREYIDLDPGAGVNVITTGRLLEGSAGGLATWSDVKIQAESMLGITLTDHNIGNVPLLATDLYGKYEKSPTGFAMVMVSVTLSNGDVVDAKASGQAGGLDLTAISETDLVDFTLPPGVTVSSIATQFTNHAFLDDIAHAANPFNSNGGNRTADGNGSVGDHFSQIGDDGRDMGNNQFGSGSTNYDNELLDAHFITGDGRGNENIGLTTVHHVFHSEHNRLMEHTKDEVLESGDLAFLQQWLLDPASVTTFPTTQAEIDALVWNGERLFQAARFGTEMQYQHLVFEEFARKVNPMVDLFVFNPTMDLDPAIFAEFAHAVYRFGHSMLTETVDRLGADGQTADDIGLIEAFLNPIEFNAGNTISSDVAAGAIVRGMTRQQGNEIDEFVTEALRNNLLGLPLDLATVNMARGREAGVPTLQELRARAYAETRSEWTRPYENWVDFAEHLKNPASIINFVAAYGTHAAITTAVTLEDKRKAATALVFGDDDGTPDSVLVNGIDVDISDRVSFLMATGAHAGGTLGGLNNVDLWIGGLAEAILPFGGMLGSTFTFVFEKQMENLQNGDRFYYLSRTQGLHFIQELENNAFSKMIMANTDLGGPNHTHLPGEIFSTPQHILEINQALQNTPDPTHDDAILQALQPKVVRATNVTVDGTTYANMLKFQGGEHVVLGGTSQDDYIIGDLGDDTVWGDEGDDLIIGGHGINRLHGGADDDIIYGGGDAEFLHGDAGNDVINGGNGIGDLIFGGDGNDFVISGVDGKEVFAGEGNDFILGTPDVDVLNGGEGDDWIEGGEGFDTIAGENSELFFNSAIIGHDVMFAGTNEMDFDAESGDDIMVTGESVMRNEGMLGFDWVSYEEHKTFGADMDLRQKIFTNVANDILRNRFDRVEAVSGSSLDDLILGDSRVGPTGPFNPSLPVNEQSLEGDELNRDGVERIDGFHELFGYASVADLRNDFANGTDVVYNSGNVLIGGGGSDTFQGNGGNDIIDGDAHLNVRIAIMENGIEIGTAEKMQGPVTFNSNASAALQALNALPLTATARALDTLVFNRTVNPGNLEIVREILYTNDTGDVDIARFSGAIAEYTIEGGGVDIDGDGFVTVSHNTIDGPGTGADGVDKVRNVEILQFADAVEIIDPNLVNAPATGNLAITIDTPPTLNIGDTLTVNIGTVTDPDNPGGIVPLTGITLTWQVEQTLGVGDWINIEDPITELPVTGPTFVPTLDHELEGLRLRVVGVFVDAHGVPEVVFSSPTVPVDNSGLPGGLDLILGPDPIFGPIDEDTTTPFEITEAMLIGTTIDPEGAPIIVADVALVDPSVGTLTDQGGGLWTFVPAPNFNGHVDISYTLSDGVNVEPAEAVLDVNPIVDTPVGVADTLLAIENTVVTYAADLLIGNDIDLDGDGLEIVTVTSGTGGTAVLNPDGSVTFTPTTGFTGDASFTYVVSNGTIDSLPVNVTVNVQDINNPPTGMTLNGGSTGTVAENDPGAIIGPIVVHDPDVGDTHTFTFTDDRFEIVGGMLKLKDGISLDFEASDEIRFHISVFDQGGLPSTNNPYQIEITVTDTNETPVINSTPTFSVEENTNFVGLLTVSDPDGPPSNFTITGGADAGLFEISSDGKVLLFKAGPDYEGAHGNTYEVEVTASDGTNTSAPQMITVNVTNRTTHLVGTDSGNLLRAGLVSPIEEALIEGLGGNDTLFGASGIDTLVGGNGNDDYYVGAGDTVEETATGGMDLVNSDSISLDLADYANVEYLQTYGATAGLNLTGNDNSNRLFAERNVEANVLTGKGGNDYYFVGAGDTIVETATGGMDMVSSSTISLDLADYANVENLRAYGAAGGINLTGNDNINVLVGEDNTAANVLTGKGGNDFYFVGAGDTIVETATGGTDGILSSTISLNLADYANVENIWLRGALSLDAVGNAGTNRIIGNDGANVITGGAGNDLLTGGLGADTFFMNAALDATSNVDRITDFNHADDTIRLENTGAGLFETLGPGELEATAFVTGTSAGDASDRIIYNNLTGEIFYDSDGTGANAATLFARLNPGTALAHDDFTVV